MVAWLDDGDERRATASLAVMHDWASNHYPVQDLMTVAQHQRIVAAKDAEMAELRDSMKFRTSLIGRLEAELDTLRAQLDKANGGQS
ncbi:hypothetical protein D3C76_1266890 [compost metagenome]